MELLVLGSGLISLYTVYMYITWKDNFLVTEGETLKTGFRKIMSYSFLL